jgi:hypothetical protein
MSLFSLSSLRNKIIAAVGVVVLAGLLLQSFSNLWIGKSHAVEELGQQTRALARAHA